jgi:hypothetical protein
MIAGHSAFWAGGRLTDLVSVGVLASWLPRTVVDDAVWA